MKTNYFELPVGVVTPIFRNGTTICTFVLLSLFAFQMAWSQSYTTTGLSNNWQDAAAWTCEGGPCNQNPYPDNSVSNTTITINHDIVYSSNNPIKLNNKGKLIVSNNAKLSTSSNINVDAGAELIVNQGQIEIGPGVLNNLGLIQLTNAFLLKDGNVVNDAQIILSNACFELTDGNFNNNSSLSGVGSVKTLSGNINNFGSWSSDVIYYFSQNSSGLPGSPSTIEEVDAVCECVLINCDILPGYFSDFKVNELIGSALTSLALNYDPNGDVNNLIYNVNDNGEVLIEIVIFNNQYANVVSLLSGFGISTTDFITDVFDPADDERVITVFFPIADLQALNSQSSMINQVYEVSPPIPNTGLIDSQGDFAQNSHIARLGWNLSGAGINIGVISDSYDRKTGVITGVGPAVTNDINRGDLPSGIDAVTVVQDYPFGAASDEGRAMLQIVHDVAPEAKLYFRTGFISEGNMAAGIADLVAMDCDIIVDDLTYMKAPFFQDGIIADAVNMASQGGVEYFSSAGNFGTKSYEATFAEAPSPNVIRHDFGGGNSLQSLNLGVGQYVIAMQWDDDFYSLGSTTGAANDLDIYLAGDDGAFLYGFNRNNLGADPIEIMPFVVVNPTTTNIIVERATGNGAPVKFKYVVFRSGDDGNFEALPAANGSTIVGHSNAEGAISVGAVRYDNTPTYGGSLLAQQSSSRGGTTTEGTLRNKPDIMAPTGGDTSVNLGAPDYEGNSLPNFFGTSAAAPHAAGVAALLIEAKTKFINPSNTDPSLDIRNLITVNAIDMGPAGFDFVNGYGFISADNSVGAFSNPSPNLISFNLENLDTELYSPGEVSFELIVEGNSFDEGTVVYFRGGVLATTFVNSSQLTVIIPEFIGNPPIYVFTAPGALTNGSDGGTSDTLTFEDIPIIDVTIQADIAEKRYGEVNPTFSFEVTVAEGEVPLSQENLDLLLPSIQLSTDALSNSGIGIYGVNVELTDVNIGLAELYNFIPEPGVFNIVPMPVTIQPQALDPIVYGDALPDISFDYTFGEQDETGVIVDAGIVNTFAANHTNALSKVNGFSLVNGVSLVNGISLVNGEPEINGFSLVNKTFFVSESTVDQSGTAIENGFSLVNGNGTEKLVYFGADQISETSIANGDLTAIANGISLVNGVSLVNGKSLVNGVSLVNGKSLVNGISLVNEVSLVNGFSLVNGISLVNGNSYVNGENGENGVNGIPLVNSESSALINGFENILVILNEGDAQSSVPIIDRDPFDIKPINVITGVEAGTQYIIPGGYLDTNFIINYVPTAVEILPAPLLVTTLDSSITYGDESPVFNGQIDGLQYADIAAEVFPDGLVYAVDCTECNVSDIPYLISGSTTNSSSNYNVTFANTGLLTVSSFDLTLKADDAIITYGQQEALNFTATADITALPFGETLNDILGELSFTPSDACTSATEILIIPNAAISNYNITYQSGELTINKADLSIEVLSTFILEGEAIPSTIEVSTYGLVCNDSAPTITFTVTDANGTPQTGILAAGDYSITADISNLQGYDQYTISLIPGQLFVNPTVGCNDRIQATDICQAPASLVDYPSITTRLQFEYTNSLDIPVYIPNGSKNRLRGNAFFVGSLPELFLPGTHTFDIYTDGGRLQWEIITNGCKSASKSANGSNANPCGTSLRVDMSAFDSGVLDLGSEVKVYPNPTSNYLTLYLGSSNSSAKLSVYNELGQLLLYQEFKESIYPEVQIDISGLKSGILFFNLVQDGNATQFKVIKE